MILVLELNLTLFPPNSGDLCLSVWIWMKIFVVQRWKFNEYVHGGDKHFAYQDAKSMPYLMFVSIP